MSRVFIVDTDSKLLGNSTNTQSGDALEMSTYLSVEDDETVHSVERSTFQISTLLQ